MRALIHVHLTLRFDESRPDLAVIALPERVRGQLVLPGAPRQGPRPPFSYTWFNVVWPSYGTSKIHPRLDAILTEAVEVVRSAGGSHTNPSELSVTVESISDSVSLRIEPALCLLLAEAHVTLYVEWSKQSSASDFWEPDETHDLDV